MQSRELNHQGSRAYLIHESLFRIIWCLWRLPLRRHVRIGVVPLQNKIATPQSGYSGWEGALHDHQTFTNTTSYRVGLLRRLQAATTHVFAISRQAITSRRPHAVLCRVLGCVGLAAG